MREKRLIKRRLLSLFLSVLMLIGILPLNLVKVYASGGVKIDSVNFPDEVFLWCMQQRFPERDEIEKELVDRTDFLFIGQPLRWKDKLIGYIGPENLWGARCFPNLREMEVREPDMKSIESLRDCRNLDEITIEGGSIDNFDLKYCNMERVIIKDCKINSFKLYDIETGIFGKLSLLSYLILDNCGLSKIETTSDSTVLDSLSINNNKFTTFDLSRIFIRNDFSCKNNQMETLNFGGLKDKTLKQVDCSVNKLTNLDISKLEALEELNCSSNQLSRLDISENVALKNLDCSSNQLSRVDIGNNDNLQVLNCSNNQFQGNFIVVNLNGLKELNVSKNKFTNLIFNEQNSIEKLDCSNNAIPYLKNLPNLKTFKGDNQQIDVIVDRNDRCIRYKNFVVIELPQGNSKVKELSGGKLIDQSYFGEGIKVDESLPSKVTYKYEVKPGMFLDVTMNITYTELDPTNVVSMKIKNQPTKLTYTDGEKLDLSGLVVTLEDNQGLTKDVAFKDFAANGITAEPTDGTALTLANNTKKVTLTKDNLTAETEALTVNAKVFDPTHVEKMVVKEQPTKLSYTEGDKLDLTKLVVTLTDNQGLTKDVEFKDFTANGITATPANDTALTVAANNGKTVKLTKASLTAETEALTVNAKVFDPEHVEKMVVKEQPTKLVYTEGEKLALAGLVVTLTDNQGVTKDVAFKDFAANGITAAPANDTALTLADNAKKVTLTKENLTAETEALTVNAKVTPTDPIVGPVDPSVTPNPDEAKNWTVTFAADQTKGTIGKANTFYVPKTAGKTLADLASKAPEVTAKAGFKVTGWNPKLDANTSINGNLTVNATFEETTTPPTPPTPQDPKVVVPDPTNPGTVPTGRVRVTFDAGEGNTIEGTNRYKYLDVLENTAWTDREVTDEIPAKAKYKDATQEFDKWDKEVPTKGNVTEETFTAIYTGNSFDLFADTLSVGETGIIVRTSIPEVKITIIKGGKVLKEAYTNDLGVVTIILNYKVEKGDVYKIIGEMKGYKTQEIFATVVSK